MNIAERIADRARQEGLEFYFGLPGSGALMDLMEAGRHAGLDLVLMGHESSAAITAAYYGHLRGGAGLGRVERARAERGEQPHHDLPERRPLRRVF